MPTIALTNGGSALVDEGLFAELSRFKWQLSPQGYAYRSQSRGGKRITVLMHRVVAAAQRGEITDHINRNMLDNRRANLRNTTKSVNAINSKPSSRNTSGYRGVTLRKDTGKWQAGVSRNGKYGLSLPLMP